MSLDHDVQKAVIVSHTGLDPDVGSMKLALFTPEDVPIELPVELPPVVETVIYTIGEGNSALTGAACDIQINPTQNTEPNTSTAMLVVEGDRCYLQGWFQVDSEMAEVVVPIPAEFAPATQLWWPGIGQQNGDDSFIMFVLNTNGNLEAFNTWPLHFMNGDKVRLSGTWLRDISV